jgi:hypothetical protein
LAIGKEDGGFLFFIRRGGQDRVMAGGMEAQDHFSAARILEAVALGADWNTTIGADFDGGANAPNVRPPRTLGDGAQDGAFFFLSAVPGLLRSHAQFAVGFVGVAMEPQSVDVGVGVFDLGDVFTGEIGREPALPELVFALDFSLGLRRWGIKEANVVELESGTELGERVGILGEEHGVIIDVDLQRPAVSQERSGEEIQVGEQEFAVIDFGADEQATAIVEHIEHGKVQRAGGEPAMGRSVQLPQFADLGALPATDGGVRAVGWSPMSQAILEGPAADLGAVELEGMQAQGLRSREAVGGRWGASQAFLEEISDRLGPGRGMVTAGGSWNPQTLFLVGASEEVSGGENIEATAGNAQLRGGFGGCQRVLPERRQDMADEGRSMTICQLLVLFKSVPFTTRLPKPSPFVGLRYASASSRAGLGEVTLSTL